ncbi:MAG: hypothetical protein H6679_05485 [Epsilonproteobacteria bacterium]|nr:hypothetical protein [Campylobacterota bacterium]
MKQYKNVRLAFLIGTLIAGQVQAFAPTNFFPPYDPHWRLPRYDDTRFRVGAHIEYGDTSSGRDHNGDKTNVLQIFDCTQSSVDMIRKPLPCDASKTKPILDRFDSNGVTDYWGQLCMTGKFRQLDVTLHGSYLMPKSGGIPGRFGLGVYLPVRYAKVEDVCMTKINRCQNDARNKIVCDFLTDDIKKKAQELGCLDICEWDKTGVGDLVILAHWFEKYRQSKEHLKNVTFMFKLGLSIPTGAERDEDKALSFSLGNDGAWGMPIALALDLDFTHDIRLGGEVEFLLLFDDTRIRRLKTHEGQTEFLLLNKGRATKNHGLTWKFYLFLQAIRFAGGLSAKVAYEYVKHDDDRLTPKSDDFSYIIVNTANSLKEWNHHNFIFQVSYDFMTESKYWLKPQMSLFYKLPITGRGVVNPHTFGGQFAVHF